MWPVFNPLAVVRAVLGRRCSAFSWPVFRFCIQPPVFALPGLVSQGLSLKIWPPVFIHQGWTTGFEQNCLSPALGKWVLSIGRGERYASRRPHVTLVRMISTAYRFLNIPQNIPIGNQSG